MHKNIILLIGGGGHCKCIVSAMNQVGGYEIGVVDNDISKKNILDAPIVGTDQDLENLYIEGYKTAIVAVGSIYNNIQRRSIYREVKSIGYSFPVFVAKTAQIRDGSDIEEGTVIFENVFISPSVKVGWNTIINTGAIIGHDVEVGANVHICPGVIISGNVVIEDGAFIGAGSTITQGVTIGRGSIIGASSTVVNNIPEQVLALGCPAKVIKANSEENIY